jgi:hypothetical protein
VGDVGDHKVATERETDRDCPVSAAVCLSSKLSKNEQDEKLQRPPRERAIPFPAQSRMRFQACRALALLLLLGCWQPTAALLGNPLALELFGRPALAAYLQRRRLPPALAWSNAEAGSCQLPHDLWAWLDSSPRVDVLALPKLDEQQLRALSDLPAAAEERLGTRLELLPDDAPVAGLVCVSDALLSAGPSAAGEEPEVVLSRSRAWVQRTLAPGPLGVLSNPSPCLNPDPDPNPQTLTPTSIPSPTSDPGLPPWQPSAHTLGLRRPRASGLRQRV